VKASTRKLSTATHASRRARRRRWTCRTPDFFNKQFSHSVPYVIFTPKISPDDKVNQLFAVYNVQPWQWVCARPDAGRCSCRSSAASEVPASVGWFTRVMRGFCLWVRDEMVYKVMGKEEGRPFVPFFLFVFFFICVPERDRPDAERRPPLPGWRSTPPPARPT
jgi:hypothetical protein